LRFEPLARPMIDSASTASAGRKPVVEPAEWRLVHGMELTERIIPLAG